MKDLKEIKYKTDKYDEEGNPIYITEAEFREHGIITTQEDEDLDENGNVIKVEPKPVVEEKQRINIRFLIKSILVGLFIFGISSPFMFGMIQVLILGIALIPTDLGEAIGLIIISIVAIILVLGFAIFMGIGRYRRLTTPDFIYKKESDGISGRYVTSSHKKGNGQTVIHISKDD